MCGICGIINFDQIPVEESNLRQMMYTMKHRGPDDEGVFIENNLGFGFVRLSIIDLSSAGHQPKLSSDDRYVIVFNGEIYNYIELRQELQNEGMIFTTKTDSEVLLNAYIHWGEDCMHRFNGMWSIAIYDRQNHSLFAARDRYGVKPFYYLLTETFLAFSSEIPPLLLLNNEKPKPNYQTIFDFLVFNRTDQTENTFFEGIKKLQHGHKFTINTQNINHSKLPITKWYDLRKKVADLNGFESSGEFKDLFSSAINLRLRSDVPVGVCLSGGLDSSSIVSILLKDYNQKDLSTFSAVYNKGQLGDETEFINEYKTSLKNMFYTTPDATSLESDLVQFVKAHAEPFPSTSPYAQYKVMKLAKGKSIVVLDGQGADEELAGYHYFFGFFFKDLLTHGRIGKFSYEMYHYLVNHHSLMGIKSFVFFMLPKYFRTKARINEKGYLKSTFANQFNNTNSIAGNVYGSKSLSDALLDHFEYKLEHLLKWEDINSMWFSLESRVPFLDFRLVEKTLATTSEWKIRKGVTKHILREAMIGILPEKIRLRRDKIGFETPEAEWFRTAAWRTIIEEVIFSQSFEDRNIIDINIVRDKYKSHIEGKINCASEIWKWIHLELWFREFID